MDLHLSKIRVQLPGMSRPLFAIRELKVASGAKVLIQGPSGKGKTTLLHLMAGLLQPVEGEVRLADRALAQLSESERCRIRRDHIGLIFQKLNLISHLTALENVRLGLASGADLDQRATEALKQVKLVETVGVLAQNLSLGQQQRVAVARVIAKAPPLVLADEPTSSLDDENAAAVMKSLFSLSPQTTLVVVSHDHRIHDRFDQVLDFEKVARA